MAFATQCQASVYTTDPDWKNLGLNIEVNPVR